MPIRFRVSLSGNFRLRFPQLCCSVSDGKLTDENRRPAAMGTVAILLLLIAGCYPFQGDLSQILTPVAPPEVAESSEPAVPEIVTLEATVAVNALRVRQEADAETPIIAGLLKGDLIAVIGRTEDGSWLKARVPDVETIGWIWAEDVTLNGDAAALFVSEDGEEMAEETAADETSDDAEMDEETADDETSDDAEMDAETADEEKPDDAEMDAETADETTSDDDEMAMDELAPSVTVQAQDVIKGEITIAEAVAQVKGWIVVHADDAGSFGPIIGQSSLEAGVTTGLTVEIDVDAATETLYAMLHRDAGVYDVFEFPGPDMPVLEEGEPISPAFRVTIGEMSMVEEDADEEAAPETPPTEPASTTLLSQGDVTTQLALIKSRVLRVRSKPETISEVLTSVTAGEIYPVAGFSADEEWVAIFLYDIEDPVWVSASVVELREVELRVRISRATVVIDRGGRLRLRSGPTLDAPIVGHVQNGESFSTLGLSVDGEWVLLVGTEVEGPVWASTGFLQLE